MSGPARLGMVAAVLVLFVGALYFMGSLDTLLARFEKPSPAFEASAHQVDPPAPITQDSGEAAQQESGDISVIPDPEQTTPGTPRYDIGLPGRFP